MVGLKIKEYLDQHGVKYSYLSRLTGIPMNLLSLVVTAWYLSNIEEQKRWKIKLEEKEI